MKPISEMSYFPLAEELVGILQSKTQNTNPLFFRVIVAYYLSIVASQMRACIKGWDKPIPINNYVIALQHSGSGKGHSTTVMEHEVLSKFKDIFVEHTFNISALVNIDNLSIKRANKNGTDTEDEKIKLEKTFNDLGALMFNFSEATVPAIKQMRQKLLIANAGSCNLTIDEIGANISGSVEALTAYLELYDKGLIRDKLVKSSSENTRFERIDGYTPANMLMFGTPSKLLDGAKTESTFMDLLEMGYARRCLFGFTEETTKVVHTSVDEYMKQLFNTEHDDSLERITDYLGSLADVDMLNQYVELTDDAKRLLVEYRMSVEKQANELSEFEAIRKSELQHRWFKVLKLAGTYAFIDKSNQLSTQYIEYAIKLVEDSGSAFVKLLTPQKPYVKLAKYLASVRSDVTVADLDTDLPSYRGSKAEKDEMIQMAIAWGYKNNIVIKKSYTDSIMFLNADTIDETNTDEMILAVSKDITTGFKPMKVAFDKLGKMLAKNGYHWLNHHVRQEYRNEENCIAGFNMLVLDIDGGTPLSTAQMLLQGYKAIYHTTKSHTEENNRYRIILPTNFMLELDAKDYKEFYNNVINTLPFKVDEQCNQRSRKWATCGTAEVIYTDGELFDVLPYIPKTTKNDERTKHLLSQEHLDNLERWVINNTGDGNRNNMLLRYALILLDSGDGYSNIHSKVMALNDKLIDKLDESEILRTIMSTISKRSV